MTAKFKHARVHERVAAVVAATLYRQALTIAASLSRLHIANLYIVLVLRIVLRPGTVRFHPVAQGVVNDVRPVSIASIGHGFGANACAEARVAALAQCKRSRAKVQTS